MKLKTKYTKVIGWVGVNYQKEVKEENSLTNLIILVKLNDFYSKIKQKIKKKKKIFSILNISIIIFLLFPERNKSLGLRLLELFSILSLKS